MQISPMGFVICGGLLLLGYSLRGSILVALMGSLAFGSTALMTLGSVGGASPLIYTFFVALLLASAGLRQRLWHDLGIIFRHSYATWVVCGMMTYALVGALLFPRLFAGQTSVFVPSRTQRGVYEIPLAPGPGNITQTGYLILGGIAFLAVCIVLLRRRGMGDVRCGFFVWCTLHTGMGVLDLGAKLAGLGDILAPIRTASYAMLTAVSQGGFVRIAGAQSEASAFGGMSLAAIAFTFTYWRQTKSRFALALTATLFILLVLSTSSTAYAGLAVLSVPVFISIVRPALMGRLYSQDFLLLALFFVLVFLGLAIVIYDNRLFDPFVQLFDTTILDKAHSASGQERSYWNYISIKSFLDTYGLGVGMGSSRASSWPVAVLSQLGLAGAAMLVFLVIALALGSKVANGRTDARDAATIAGVRASGLAGLISGSLISGTADPGMLFFVCLAIIVTANIQAADRNAFEWRIRPVQVHA